jgi:integrase
LRWRDVDLSAGAVTFVTTRVKAGTRTVEATPKTPGSVRRVALDAGTLNALRRWQRAQSAERLAAGAGWCTRGERSDDYVVADEVGRPYAPQTLTRWFNRESARLELPAIRLHDGRHSHATTALNDARQPVKVVSQRLGHSDVATTMRLYQHVLPRDDQRAADETAAAIFGQAVTPGVT